MALFYAFLVIQHNRFKIEVPHHLVVFLIDGFYLTRQELLPSQDPHSLGFLLVVGWTLTGPRGLKVAYSDQIFYNAVVIFSTKQITTFKRRPLILKPQMHTNDFQFYEIRDRKIIQKSKQNIHFSPWICIITTIKLIYNMNLQFLGKINICITIKKHNIWTDVEPSIFSSLLLFLELSTSLVLFH